MEIINLGKQITEDGVIEWRNNGGITERRFLYANIVRWETISDPSPKTTEDLLKMCADECCTYRR